MSNSGSDASQPAWKTRHARQQSAAARDHATLMRRCDLMDFQLESTAEMLKQILSAQALIMTQLNIDFPPEPKASATSTDPLLFDIYEDEVHTATQTTQTDHTSAIQIDAPATRSCLSAAKSNVAGIRSDITANSSDITAASFDNSIMKSLPSAAQSNISPFADKFDTSLLIAGPSADISAPQSRMTANAPNIFEIKRDMPSPLDGLVAAEKAFPSFRPSSTKPDAKSIATVKRLRVGSAATAAWQHLADHNGNTRDPASYSQEVLDTFIHYFAT